MKAVRTRALVRILVANINTVAGSLICKTPSVKGVDGWTPVLRKGKQWPSALSVRIAEDSPAIITKATKAITKRATLSLSRPYHGINRFNKNLALNGGVSPFGRKYTDTIIHVIPSRSIKKIPLTAFCN